MYEKVGAKNDWITDANVEIRPIDSTLSNLESYSNITLQRLAAAFGIPDELLGLGRGSTEATASVRIRAFFGTITTLQGIVARTYSQNIIDRITGVPGSVWLEFNEVSDESFFKYATAIAALRTGMDADAIIPAEWAREKLGIPADDDPLRQGMAEMVLDRKVNPPNPFGMGNQAVAPVKEGNSKTEEQMPEKKLM
jgi:phage gp29-like protein